MKKQNTLRSNFISVPTVAGSFLLCFIFFFGAFFVAHAGSEENVLDKRITLVVENEPVKVVLNEISRLVEVKFVYSAQRIPAQQKVSISAKNERVGDILNILLGNINVVYYLSGSQIVLLKKDEEQKHLAKIISLSEKDAAITKEAIFDKPIKGVIKNDKGEPLSDVSMIVKGTKKGTTTDANGEFAVDAEEGQSLVVSRVGYITTTVVIGADDYITISLQPELADLTDVVVIGYGTARKKDLTGSVTSVQAKNFNKGTYTSPDQLIQGKAAGVLVINNTGQPGGSSTIRIRGTSSVRSGNQPLFVLDGVPLSGSSSRPGSTGSDRFGNDGGNPFNYINPNDIAGIEILKDASATAIYGSRGANGVVLITTKRGKTGATYIDVNSTTGASTLLKKLEVLNADEYRTVLKKYDQASGDFGADVDAFDAITQTGLIQNYNVAMGAGKDDAKYRLSLSYLDQTGIIKTSELKKLTALFNTNLKFLKDKKLGLDINILASQTNERIAPISAFADFTGNLISQALQWNPTHLLIKPGTDSAWIDPLVAATTINPLAQLNYFADLAKVTTILASVSPSYKITKYLEYKFLYSINHQSGVRKGQIDRLINVDGFKGRGGAFYGSGLETNTQITHTLSFNKDLTPDFSLNAVIGYEWLTFDTKSSALAGKDFENNGLKYYNVLFTASPASREVFSNASPTSELQSYFGRAILNIKDKYVLTGTMRADGSTKFGTNNKYGYFPSFAVAWNANKEGFLSGVDFVSNLKVRAGWGKTGNQEFPSGASRNRFRLKSGGATERINFANPDLRWETSSTTNLGIDFTVIKKRLSGSVDYFYKKTSDVLFETELAAPTPKGGKIWKNLEGNVINKGIEIALLAILMEQKELSWSLSGNISFLKNIVTDLPGFYQTGALRGQGFSDVFGQRMISGQPLNVWYLKKYEGLDATGQSIYTGGDYAYYYLGSPNPKTLMGISSDFSYKSFYATINFNGSFGQYVFNNTTASVLGITNIPSGKNVAKSMVDGTVKESTTNSASPSTRNLENGSYIKLSNASIGYRIGDIGSIIKGLNVTVTGQNLLVFTKYSGFDPEVNTEASADGVPSLGVEYIPYPASRTIQLGLNFSL